MNTSDIPTIGAVSRLVRNLASSSCSLARVDRRVAHFAPRLRATGAPSESARLDTRGDLIKFDKTESLADVTESIDHRPAGGNRPSKRGTQFSEQSAIAETGRLLEGRLVTRLSRDEHRHEIQIRRQLMTKVGPRRARASNQPSSNRDRSEQTASNGASTSIRPIRTTVDGDPTNDRADQAPISLTGSEKPTPIAPTT